MINLPHPPLEQCYDHVSHKGIFTNIFRRNNLLPLIEDSSDNYLCLLLIKIGYSCTK